MNLNDILLVKSQFKSYTFQMSLIIFQINTIITIILKEKQKTIQDITNLSNL